MKIGARDHPVQILEAANWVAFERPPVAIQGLAEGGMRPKDSNGRRSGTRSIPAD